MALAEMGLGLNGIGRNGSWPKWHWPKWLLAKLGTGPSGVGRNGIGRNGFGREKVYFRSQILERPSIGEYWNISGVPVLPENVVFTSFRMCWCHSEAYNTGMQKWSSIVQYSCTSIWDLKHTISLLFEIWLFVYKTTSSFSESVILRNQPVKFPIPLVLDLTGCKMHNFLWEKVSKSVKNYMEVIEKHIKVYKKSQNWQMSYFSPLCQLQISVSCSVLLECITYMKLS